MANSFSTATLMLGVDTDVFNKQLKSTANLTKQGLAQMSAGADAFGQAWDEATDGIKDTKRIISGILISQGFYTIMNGLTMGAAAALTFAANMETAGVSMEYFVEGADKAAKSLAYLREINEFAARTPFSTEKAIEMSKYMQAVGVSMNVTKSFLQVITDASAATGATEENLQRVVFALGQMMTKGRIANEEIRQLANANIPIYDILQEELNMTGSQISNIGNYWIDADKAIVAILNGLNKRYEGAADRISDTVTGMMDTIADDAKIIAQQAGDGLYEGLAGGLTAIRDKLDEYREAVTEFGSAGLFNHIILDIDPTGQFGTQLLTLIGNTRQLGAAIYDLYQAAKPLISLFGESLYMSLNLVEIGVTGLTRVGEGLLSLLNKLGIECSSLSELFANLFIMYQAGKWMLVLGNGVLFAGRSVASLVASLHGVLPASMSAQAGLLGVLGTVGLLAAAVAGLAALMNSTSSFAGLDVSSKDVLPSDYNTAMDDYLKKMEEYNAAIKKYQEQFNEPYTSMDTGTGKAVDDLEDVEKASKKAAKSVKNDWTSAFDEVYTIPDQKEPGGGSALKAPEMPDLGELIKALKFTFPSVGETKLVMPDFPWDDVFSGGLLDDTALDKDWWRTFLPATIFGALTAGATLWAKAAKKKDINADGGIGSKGKFTSDIDPNKAAADIEKAQAKQAELLKKLEQKVTDINKKIVGRGDTAISVNGRPTTGLDGDVANGELIAKEIRALQGTIETNASAIGASTKEVAGFSKLTSQLNEARLVLNKDRLASIEATIHTDLSLTQAEVAALRSEQKALLKENLKLGATKTGNSIGGLTVEGLKKLVDSQAAAIIDGFSIAGKAGLPTTLESLDGKALTATKLTALLDSTQEYIDICDRIEQILPGWAASTDTEATRLYQLLQAQHNTITDVRKLLLDGNKSNLGMLEKMMRATSGVNTSTVAGVAEVSKSLKDMREQLSKGDVLLTKLTRMLDSISEASYTNTASVRSEILRSIALEEETKQLLAAQHKARLAADTAEKKAIADKKAAHTSYMPDNEVIRAFANKLDTIDAPVGISEAVKNIKETIKEIEKTRTSELDSIKANLISIDDYVGDIKLQGGQLNANLSKHALSLAKQFGVDMPNMNAKMLKEQVNMRLALEAAFTHTLPLNGVSSNYPDAVAGLDVPRAFAALKKSVDNIGDGLLSGSVLSGALNGVGAFEGTALDSVIRAFGKAFPAIGDMGARDSNFLNEIKAALGQYLEPLVTYAAAQQFKAIGGEVGQGGFLAVADGIVQIDSTLKLGGRLLSNDIKTVSGQYSEQLIGLSSEYMGGIRKLSSDVLRALKPDNFYQLGMQSVAFDKTPGPHTVGMSVFNRDFDVKSIAGMFERFQQNMRTIVKDGRMFSTDAVRQYAAVAGKTNASAMEMVEGYMRNVVLPTLGIPVEMFAVKAKDAVQNFENALKFADLGVLGKALQPYLVEYSAQNINGLDIAGNSSAARQLNDLIATVVDNENITDYLHSYIRFNSKAGELAGTVASIDMNSTLRQYESLRNSTSKWAQNILKTDKSFSPKAISSELIGTVDTLVNNYIHDVSTLGKADAAELTKNTAEKLKALAKQARDHASGAKIELFKNASKSYEDMSLFATSLERLAANLKDTSKTARLFRSVIDRIARINDSIAANIPIGIYGDFKEEVGRLFSMFDGLGREVSQLFDIIGLTANEATLGIVRRIEDYREIAKRLTAPSSFDALFEKIALPFDVAPLKDTAGYIARELSDAVTSGILKVSEGMTQQFEADVSALAPNTKGLAIKFIGDVANKTLEIPAKINFFDFETLDLIMRGIGGGAMPPITQMSFYGATEDKVYTWLVDYGVRNQDVINRMASIQGLEEAWADMDYSSAMSLQRLVEEFKEAVEKNPGAISGYNAVNSLNVGGGFDAQLLEYLRLELSGSFTRDVMSEVTDILSKYTGSHTTLKLGEAYKLATGGETGGAHAADFDVLMVKALHEAITDGTFEEVVKTAAANGFEGGIKEALRAASATVLPPKPVEAVVENTPTIVARVLSSAESEAIIKTQASEAAEAALKSAAANPTNGNAFTGAMGAGADDAAKRAAAGGPDVWGAFKGLFKDLKEGAGGVSDEVKKNFKTLWERWSNPTDSYAANASTKSLDDIFDMFSELSKQNVEYMSLARTQKNVAEKAIASGAATKDTSWVKEAFTKYDEALKEYSKTSEKFYKAVTEQVAGGLKGFENSDTVLKTISNLGDGAQNLAFILDPKTGQMRLIGDALLSGKNQISEAAITYAADFLKHTDVMSGSVEDALATMLKAIKDSKVDDLEKDAKILYDAFVEVSKVTADTDLGSLSKGAKAFYDGLSDFGKNTVIFDMAADIEEGASRLRYAGSAASDVIDGAAKTVAGSFKNIGARLLNGVAGFGILDVAFAGFEGVMQHMQDIGAGKYLQGTLGASESTADITKAIADAGFNIGEDIGSSVYHGAAQAVGQGLLTGVVSSLAATAGAKIGAAIGSVISPGIGTAIGAVVGTLAGTITGAVSSNIVMATGGKSNTNMYLDDYLKALQDGQVITNETLAQAEEALGRALTIQEKANLEIEARKTLTFQTMSDANNTWWERDDVNKVLYGKDTKATLTDNNKNDTDLAVRIAMAVGAINKESFGSYAGYDENGVHAQFLTVKDPGAIKELQSLLGVNLELRDIAGSDGAIGVYDTANKRFLGGNNKNIDGLSEAIKLMYEQGNSSSAITEKISEVLENNSGLKDAVIKEVGQVAALAYESLDGYIDIYNKQMGTQLSRQDVDETNGMGAALMEQMIKTYEAITTNYLAEATTRSSDTWNRNVANGDTSTTLWGANLAGTTQETIDALATFGIKLSEAGITIESDLTGAVEQSYVMLQTSADDIKKNLAGWTVDATGYGALDFSQLTVTAEDAEILASAGIQINGNGTVTFMKADNVGSSGAERDLTLDATSFSDSVKAALQSQRISLDFEAKSLDFDIAALQENMSGAMFKLPDSFSSYASEEVNKALDGIGDIMDSGYFMLTDKSLLQGNKTISSYLEGMLGASGVNEKVATAIGNIDTLIQREGASAAENISEWAAGIVMPSPIRKEEMTAEIEAAFGLIGVTFSTYAGQYMMQVSNAGEHMYDGITMIDKEKWLSLDESLRLALTGPDGLGVKVTEMGNEVMVDLSSTFDNGISDVVNLFIGQPDVWNQIPDAVKAYLEQAGIVSEEGFLVLKNISEGKLTEIQGAYITKWEDITADTLAEQIILSDGTETNLDLLKSKVDDGLLKIAGVVDASEIPELTKNQIAVPFENLPVDIQQALQGQSGLEGKLIGSSVILENATRDAFAGMLTELGAASSSAVGTASNMAAEIGKAVSDALVATAQLENMQSRAKGIANAGLFHWGESTDAGTAGTGKYAGYTVYKRYGSGGSFAGYVVLRNSTGEGKRLSEKEYQNFTGFATGGTLPTDGLTLAGELGRELAILPDGSTTMLGAHGKGELLDLPEGTRILNNADTEAALKYTGPISKLSTYADGNTDVIVGDKQVAQDEEFRATFIAFMQAFIAERTTASTDVTATVADTTPGVSEAAQYLAENTQVAIRGAVAALLEHYNSGGEKIQGSLTTHFTALNTALDADTTKIVTALNDAMNNISKAVGSLNNLVNGLRSEATKPGKQNGDYDWRAVVAEAKQDYLNATTEAERILAHAKAEAARATQGFSGGADGSEHIQLSKAGDKLTDAGDTLGKAAGTFAAAASQLAGGGTDAQKITLGSEASDAYQKTTIKSNARGGLITGDTLIRAGEFGREEAVMPLEQPSIMSDVGATIGSYITAPTGVTAEDINAAVSLLIEAWNVAIRGAVAAIAENEANHSTTLFTNIEKITEVVDKNLGKLSALDTLSSAVSSLSSSVGNIKIAADKTNTSLDAANGKLDTKASEATLNALPAGLSAEFGQWFIDSLAEARTAYGSATTDTERAAAHMTAEDIRNLLGYSGGADGSERIALGNQTSGIPEETLIQLFGTLESTQTSRNDKLLQQLDYLGKGSKAFYELLQSTLVDSFSKWLSQFTTTQAEVITSVNEGTLTVANAVSSYINWSQNTISSLQAEVASLHAAASLARRGSTIKGSAKGSLVTKDALYRAGEGGLNEAIVPLEQPSIMTQVGATIADYMPATDSSSILAKLDENAQIIALAIRGAVAAVTENEATHTDGLLTNIDAINKTVAENLGKLDALDTLSTAASNLGSNVNGVSSAVKEVTTALTEGLKGKATDETLMAVPTAITAEMAATVADTIAAAQREYAAATTDAERNAAHTKAEDARGLLGYSGGVDGSEHIKTGSAAGVATFQEFWAASLTGHFGSLSELISGYHTALTALLTANNQGIGQQLTTMITAFDVFSGSFVTTMMNMQGAVVAQVRDSGLTVANAVGSYVNWSQNTISSLQSEIGSLRSALAAASSLGSKKGSASGSLVTEDAMYRAGELGLNEAIIPLERPDVLKKVGSAIAGFMPVEYSSKLSAVAGIQNAGLRSVQSNPVQQQQDMITMADALTQKVLEAVLPQIAYSNSDDDEGKRPLYVGTLIADDSGLKTLERKLYDIRMLEATRK